MQKINNRNKKSISIGKVSIQNNIFLAPMAGVSDLPFRVICRELGCGLAYTEMISAKGLIYRNEHTIDLLRVAEEERPVPVQIFGSEPAIMAEAAKIVAASGADIIDINMGCPTPKIVKNGDGSALMLKPQLAYEIMASVAAAVNLPVTVKIRKGWDETTVNAVEMAVLAQKAGISAIAVHGRTRAQFYSGTADWDIIKAVKEAVCIPVIGNGDIRTPFDAERMLLYTGCDAIMIGRAAEGNPWLFKQTEKYLAAGVVVEPPALSERINMIFRHLNSLLEYKGQYRGIREMRTHATWYTKGLRNSAEVRVRLNKAETQTEFAEILGELLCEA